jgi:hypothetical protein
VALEIGRCGFFWCSAVRCVRYLLWLCCGVGWKSRDGEGVLEKGRIGGYLGVGYFSIGFGGWLGVCELEVVVLSLWICGDFRNWIHLFVNQNLYQICQRGRWFYLTVGL